jgi:hypothetical protein
MNTLPKWLVSIVASALCAVSSAFGSMAAVAQTSGTGNPPVKEASWNGYSGNFPTAAEACQDLANFRGSSLAGITVNSVNPYGYPLSITCQLPEWITGGEISAVSCHPWSFESGMYGPYIYVGDLNEGLCVHHTLMEDFLEGYNQEYADDYLGGKKPSYDKLCNLIPHPALKAGCKAAANGLNLRRTNPPKAESPVWKSFPNYKNGLRYNGKNGRDRDFYDWDFIHDDIEVYDYNGNHKGSMDPISGEMYKPAKPGRHIRDRI